MTKTEIKEIRKRKTIEKNNETKNWFVEKIIDQTSTTTDKENRERRHTLATARLKQGIVP